MAAKLKKRAMADYAIKEEPMDMEEEEKVESLGQPGKKRLRLALAAARGAAGIRGQGDRAGRDPLAALEGARDPREAAEALARFQSRLPQLEAGQVSVAAERLCFASFQSKDADELRPLAFLALKTMVESRAEETAAKVKDGAERWLEQLQHQGDKSSPRLTSAALGMLTALYRGGHSLGLPRRTHEKVHRMAMEKLGDLDHSVSTNALVLAGLCATTALQDEKEAARTMVLVGRYTQSSDPRVRHSAFLTLKSACELGRPRLLDPAFYGRACKAMDDDFEGVRSVALELAFMLAQDYPEEKVSARQGEKGGGSAGGGADSVRLVDDAFGRICNAINDLSVKVRELAATLMGKMEGVSQEFLEQTLDKKLMSNMRVKRSAHEREAKMVSSGEWSTGKKWADDAPKEELEANSVNLLSFGACGAFIHGLEDELSCVRTAAVESLTTLSIRNSRLASLALDFLVDMFNDEIEAVRLKAIESLRRIAPHISLQVHQLETVLSALDDFSLVVRERLHGMLQACRVATKDGLQAVVAKLLENLKKYPQDRRSILHTFKRLGSRHSKLTLPLTTQLLEIHPFLDTAEPDIDDPGYLCILVLIFNAAQYCPTLEPLLDQHTKRHYYFMLDTYPHLMPEGAGSKKEESAAKDGGCVSGGGGSDGATSHFLRETLRRVRDSEHLGMTARTRLLQQAAADLSKVASIEPALAGFANFADLYLQCQTLFLKTLSTRFWLNPRALPSQQLAIVEGNLRSLSSLSLQLSHRFCRLGRALENKVRLLEINIKALSLVFLVRASNKSALQATEHFLKEVEAFSESVDNSTILASPFISSLIKRLSDMEDYKPGNMVRILQPLLLACPLESLTLDSDPSSPSSLPNVSMASAVIYEPAGMNETPLKYTAGMVLAVPVDAELSSVHDPSSIRLAIRTADQKVQLVTPKPSQFLPKEDEENGYRLVTDALMSHQVWSEALHVEISVVLDVSDGVGSKRDSSGQSTMEQTSTIQISEPTKVFVLPKAIKRGI